MAYNEKLASTIRAALEHLPNVEEKKMFGSLAFMVDGKMSIAAGPDRIMVRVDPTQYEKLMEKPGCRPVIMRGSHYTGYIYVSEESLQETKDFDFWITAALNYNKIAKASRK